jgi:cytochrome c peroxidase
MHNGVYPDLFSLMDFYNHGGGSGLGIAPDGQTLPPDSLHLTASEITDIIAFMNSLEDQY